VEFGDGGGGGDGGRVLPPIEPNPLFESIQTFENDIESSPKKLKADEERAVSNKNPVKDFCYRDIVCVCSVQCVVREVANGSLDLAARAERLQAFFYSTWPYKKPPRSFSVQ
jgi:hypothetical protein